MELWQVLFWAIVTIVLVVAEIGTVQLIAIWFGAGSLVAFITSFFGIDFKIQIAVFLLVSIVLLLLTRPFVKKFLSNKRVATNADSIIGQKGLVYEPIDNLHQSGRITVNGLDWAARAEDDNQTFEVNQLCEVVRIEGVKAIVRALSQ